MSDEPQAPDEPATAGRTTGKGQTRTIELTRGQQSLARRVAESKATIPSYSLRAEVDMERAVALIEAATATSGEPTGEGPADDEPMIDRPGATIDRPSGESPTGDGPADDTPAVWVAPTYTDLLVKATAITLREQPQANSSYRDGTLLLHSRVNVGVMLASNPGEVAELLVPTLLDADQTPLPEIARASRGLAERLQAGTITPPELSGATFTVTTLTEGAIESFTPIVLPPQTGALSIGAVKLRPVIRRLLADDTGGHDGGVGGDAPPTTAGTAKEDGASRIVARQTAFLTLSCDHRALPPPDAARFLARVRLLLEEPAAIVRWRS